MTCRELTAFLVAYVDDELSDDVRTRFEAHLASCPKCSSYVDAYRQTIRLASAASRDPDGAVPDVPEELVEAILAARRTRG